MWKFYVGSVVLLILVLLGSAMIQLKGGGPVVRPAIYQPSTSPSQDDNAMSKMRIQ